MFLLAKICFSITVFIRIVSCDWVEIPQLSNKKSLMGVTPYNPYIYEKTIFFSTTPSTYDTIRKPEVFQIPYTEQKKSITKLPDSIIRNVLTTEMPVSKKTTLRPPHTQPPTIATTEIPITRATLLNDHKKVNKNSTKPSKNKVNRRNDNGEIHKNSTKNTSTSKPQQNLGLDLDEEYEEIFYEDDAEYDDDDSEGLGEEYYDDTEYDDDDDEPAGATQKGTSDGYTYVSFVPYLQNIQSTLMRTSHKNVKGKISFLSEIKDRLLYAIKEKIASIWSPKSKRRQTRSTRGDHHASWDKGDSGMDFPSHEGALLTIGFLTFAVFLIKCILKLIHAIKGKKNGYKNVVMVPMSMMSMVTPATTGRKRREIEDSIHILDLIEKYKFQ